jgi:hypothetical protein
MDLIRKYVTHLYLYYFPQTCPLQNPLNFSFPPELDEESLMSGADQLSRAVLQSGMLLYIFFLPRNAYISLDAEVVRPNHDITAQMTGRKERLSFLISFINENGVLPKVIFNNNYYRSLLLMILLDVAME